MICWATPTALTLLSMENKSKDKAKKDMQLYQWLYITPFSVIAALGVISVALIAIFIFICSAKYLIVSFSLPGAKIFPALVLTFIGFCVVAVLVLSEIILIKKYIKAIKEFNKEKKEVLGDNSQQ